MAIKVIFTLSIFAGGGRRVDMKLSELRFCNSEDSHSSGAKIQMGIGGRRQSRPNRFSIFVKEKEKAKEPNSGIHTRHSCEFSFFSSFTSIGRSLILEA
jgi:hypothetical protein